MNALRQVRLKTKASLIIRLIDAYTCQGPLDPRMEMFLEDIPQKPLYKPEGYAIFTGLPIGSYVFHLRSNWYEQIELHLKVESEEEPMIIHTVLVPRPNYPVGRGRTVVRGMVVDERGRPLSGVEVQARLSGKMFAKARLSQEAEIDQNRLILNYVNGRIRVGERFWLSDDSVLDEDNGSLESGEVIQVAEVSDDAKREIVLKQSLRFHRKRGSLLSTFITAFSSKSGEIAIFFPNERSKHYDAQLIFRIGSFIHVKEVRLEEGSLLNLGVISLAD